MADELPSGDRAVFAYLEMIALAFSFEGASALLNGKSWMIWGPALACAGLLFVAGVKFPWIKRKLVSVDWDLWGKRINRALLVALVLAFITVAATIYYEWRQASAEWTRISREFSSLFGRAQTPSKEQLPKPENAPGLTPKSSAAPSTRPVDWHDKQNWRRYLRRGMTRTEVRRLFGEPERIFVVGSIESWDYGSGDIQFETEDHPDGSLWVWSEPRR